MLQSRCFNVLKCHNTNLGIWDTWDIFSASQKSINKVSKKSKVSVSMCTCELPPAAKTNQCIISPVS